MAKKTIIKTTNRSLGACLSQPDNRNIMIARVQAHVERPKQFYFDDSSIPTTNQLGNGSCVGQAEGSEVECRELKDTGNVTEVSKRWLYAQCKKVDGLNGQGTFPSVAANIKVNRGVPKKEFCRDDNSLPHDEYVVIPEDSLDVKEDAGVRVASGYVSVPAVQEEILQAIFQNGTYTATLDVGDWSTMPLKPKPSIGYHRIRLNGYREIENDVMIWFRNSWGNTWSQVRPGFELNDIEKEKVKRGDGFFLFSEYKAAIFEQLVYTDVPYKMIMEARAKKYIFTRDLQYKNTGTDVIELQKRLAKEVAPDGLPCFRYPSALSQQFTTYFGVETRKAVERYQEKNKIAKPGDAGYGRVGPKTKASLNKVATATPVLAGVAKRIIINAGHDNTDPGAVTLKEADETKLIRDAVVAQLQGSGFEVFQVPDDKNLAQSIAFANKIAPGINDGLCIDIHLNASSDKKARGIEAYCGLTESSRTIASTFSRHLSKSLNTIDRGAKSDTETHVGELGWIRKTKTWATLLEVGFITNASDMAVLRGNGGYKLAGKAITDAILELWGIEIDPPKPEKKGINDAKKLISEGLDILNAI